jgi:hypothetical protein
MIASKQKTLRRSPAVLLDGAPAIVTVKSMFNSSARLVCASEV